MDRARRSRSRFVAALLAALTLGAPFAPGVGLAAPLPPLPEASAPAGAGAVAPAASSPAERVRRGLVTLERDGRVLGYGTILPSDGRVLTALSVVGSGDAVDARYADGKVAKGKVSSRDPRWDLALLVVPPPVPTEGLVASEADPTTTEVRVAVPGHDGSPRPVPVEMKGRVDAMSRSGEPLSGALEIAVHTTGSFAGAPLLDSSGRVLGVLVHACRAAFFDAGAASGPAAPPCAPLLVGAPVTVVRGFLTRVPQAGTSGWLGIVGQAEHAVKSSEHAGVRVMAVAPDGPADQAGLRAADKIKAGGPAAGGKPVGGDLIVAVDGAPVDSPDTLAAAIARHAPGERVTLLVYGPPAGDAASGAPGPGSAEPGQRFREVAVRLAAAP